MLPNKDAAQGDLHFSCASASPHTISKRRSDDLDNIAHACSKEARLSSICMPSTGAETAQMTSKSDQALNVGTRAQVVAYGPKAALSRNGLCGEDEINAIVIRMLWIRCFRSLSEKI